MEKLIEISLKNGEYWTLGVLLFSTILLAILKLPIFTKLTANQSFSILTNLLWAATGISGLFIFTIFLKESSKNQGTREKERMEYLLKHFQEIPNNNPSFDSLFNEVSNRIHPKPINIQEFDSTRCWIETNDMSHLLMRPQIIPQEIIQNNIPNEVYYVLEKEKDTHFNKLFFKIKLKNGLEGWVIEDGLNKNPKCYD